MTVAEGTRGISLEARGVGYRAAGRWILQEASAAFPPGSFTAVVGPNGSGKTTLLRLLAGALRPAAGEVLLGGRALGRIPRREAARSMAWLPQDGPAAFALTVEEAVALGRLPHLGPWRPMGPEDRRAVRAAMDRLELGGLAPRTLPTLSGGERQRVLLARALAQEAPLLLLDEPTTALDIRHQIDLMELLAGLHREGRTLLAALHDLPLVWDWVPSVLLLREGRVAAEGPAREVLAGAQVRAAFGVESEVSPGGALRLRRL